MSDAYRRLSRPVSADRWGPEGPPRDAYSRTTDRERFRPLHAFMAQVLAQLESVMAVDRAAGSAADLDFVPAAELLDVIRLVPRAEGAASITIGTTTFPGLVIRCGHGVMERFPACGCDACNETAESEAYRFESVILAVAQGGFSESVVAPMLGPAWYEYELRSDGTTEGRRARITRERARELRKSMGRIVHWAAWPGR